MQKRSICGCHKGQTLFLFGVIGLGVVASSLWREKRAEPPASPTSVSTVAVYYFHGSIRCQKCLEIERISREAVLSFYEDDLAAGRMKWASVNYELPENRHYFDDFNFGLPSLAVEVQRAGRPAARLVLSNTWDKVEIPEDLENYVIIGIEAFRNGEELPVLRPVTP